MSPYGMAAKTGFYFVGILKIFRYADELCITPSYLSKITNRAIKAAPKELIDRQIILEMKHLLINTDISVKELASRFHFDSVSYMARFFRRHAGCTPAGFRKQ